MSNKIQLRRGLQANLPVLNLAEPAFTTDTKRLYIGTVDGNVLVNIGDYEFDLVNGADGYLAFFTGPNKLAGDNDLFWDRENNRLGIHTETPTHELTVDGYITPATDNVHRLGTPTQRWEAIHLGPSSLHISSTAAETGTAFDWTIGIDKTTGNAGKLLIYQGEQIYLSIDPISSEVDFPISLELTTHGTIKIAEGAAPLFEVGYGKIYVSAADKKLHFIDSLGNDSVVGESAGLQTTVDEHYKQLSDAIQTILKDLDGYGSGSGDASDITISEHYRQHSEATQTILKDLDGYAADTTVSEHYRQHSEAIQTILKNLDGYASDQTVSEHYRQHSQALKDVISVLDGYSTDTGLTQTESEHYKQLSDAIQTILKDLDGYGSGSGDASDQTVSEHYRQHSEAIQTILKDLDGYSGSSGVSEVTFNQTKAGYTRAFQDVRSACDGYVAAPNTAAIGDGYLAFFIDGGRQIAGDNDLYWDRVNNRLGIKTTTPSGLLHVRSDGIDSFTALPLFERIGTSDSSWLSARFKARIATNMGANFASGLLFEIEDDTSGPTLIGGIECRRTTADNSGRLALRVYNAGVATFPVMVNTTGELWVNELASGATPDSGYGAIYAKTADGKLYYKDDAGTEYDLTATGSGTGVSEVTFNQTKAGYTRAFQDIRSACDGYASAHNTAAIGDGYLAFFIDGDRQVAGDNDLFWDRVNNRLGIGTIVPETQLHIFSEIVTPTLSERRSALTTGVYYSLASRHTTTDAGVGIATGFGTGIIFQIKDSVLYNIGAIQSIADGAKNSGKLTFYTFNAGAATEAMTIKPDGKVGIGTTTPEVLLHLSSAGVTSQSQPYFDTYSSSIAYHSSFVLRKSHQDTIGNTATIDGENLGSFTFRGNSGAAFTTGAFFKAVQDGAASTYTPAKFMFYTSDGTNPIAERINIQKNGYVGIGTTAPTSLLTVAGDVSIGGNIKNNALREAIQSIRQACDGYASAPNTAAIGDGYVAFFIDGGKQIAGDNDLYWDRVNNRLGIGTSTPAAKFYLVDDIESTVGSIAVEKIGAGTTSPSLVLRKNRGSVSAPTAVSVGDAIGAFNMTPYDGSVFNSGALIRGVVEGISGSNVATYIEFWTKDTAGTYNAKNRITSTGEFWVKELTSGATPSSGYGAIYAKSADGKLYYKDDAGVEYDLTATSDIRFKENISDIENATSTISTLNGVKFNWKKDYRDDEKENFGLIAQEVEKVLPNLVDTGSKGIKTVRYTQIIPLLIESVKELKAENDELKQRLAGIEKKLGI